MSAQRLGQAKRSRREQAGTSPAPGGGRQPGVRVGGRVIPLTNLDKVYYPATGFTKQQVLDYYARIAPALLPHLRDRPLTLKRYPNGVAEPFFYEKRCPAHRPDWMKTAPVWSDRSSGNIDYCLANDEASLLWIVNTGSLELHTLLARARDVQRPTCIAFDLDPGPPAGLVQCARVALLLRQLLAWLDLQCFPKTSGSKGLQIYVPLNTPVTYDQTKPLSRAIARLLEGEHPALVVSNMSKKMRPGKVFIDWSQNDEHKTTVSVYSLRAREKPQVSAPLTWEEVARAAESGNDEPLRLGPEAVLERVGEMGDLFAPVQKLRQRLRPELLRHLAAHVA